MAREQQKLHTNSQIDAGLFPSLEQLIVLYSLGAIFALGNCFMPKLDPMQITVCLSISWMLFLGALGMGFLLDAPEEEEF
ncbi:hypothetical protein JNK13_02650 [bacterium]|nr:hypothetical protein [bacterium]